MTKNTIVWILSIGLTVLSVSLGQPTAATTKTGKVPDKQWTAPATDVGTVNYVKAGSKQDSAASTKTGQGPTKGYSTDDGSTFPISTVKGKAGAKQDNTARSKQKNKQGTKGKAK